MEKLLVATMLFMGTAISGFMRNGKAIALVNLASSFLVSQVNALLFEKDMMAMQNRRIHIAMNDLSDDKTKAASLPVIQKVTLVSFAKKDAGTLYFIDTESKKQMPQGSLPQGDEKIKEVHLPLAKR